MSKATIIVAYDENRLIGRNNDLPWPPIKEDMKLFKERTTGGSVIMGRKTWDSIPEKFRPLPNRKNIVISSTMAPPEKLGPDGPYMAQSPKVASILADFLSPRVFIIGGAQIYKSALESSFVDRIIASEIKGKFEGDTYFPQLEGRWMSRVISNHDLFDVVEYVKDNN